MAKKKTKSGQPNTEEKRKYRTLDEVVNSMKSKYHVPKEQLPKMDEETEDWAEDMPLPDWFENGEE